MAKRFFAKNFTMGAYRAELFWHSGRRKPPMGAELTLEFRGIKIRVHYLLIAEMTCLELNQQWRVLTENDEEDNPFFREFIASSYNDPQPPTFSVLETAIEPRLSGEPLELTLEIDAFHTFMKAVTVPLDKYFMAAKDYRFNWSDWKKVLKELELLTSTPLEANALASR